MDAYQIIEYIRTSPKKTPVRVWLQTSQPVAFPAAQQFSGGNGFSVVFGDWEDIRPVLEENREKILSQQVENDARNSAIPLLDKKDIHARIEPGAIIREQVQIGDNAVIMMGAVINIGAVIGEGTMIDMGAVLGRPGNGGETMPHRCRRCAGRRGGAAFCNAGSRRGQCAHWRQRGSYRGSADWRGLRCSRRISSH